MASGQSSFSGRGNGNSNLNDKTSSCEGLTQLQIAVKSNLKEKIKELLKNGVDINAKSQDGYSTLYYATAEDTRFQPIQDAETIEILLSHGAKIDPKSEEARKIFKGVMINGTAEIAKLFQKYGIDMLKLMPNDDLIDSAILNKNSSALRFLLKNGSFNWNRKRGAAQMTNLHIAVMSRKHANAELLLKAGADVNCRKSNGETPLHIAVLSQDVESVKLLLYYDASIEIETDFGELPLSMASRPMRFDDLHSIPQICRFIIRHIALLKRKDIEVGLDNLLFATANKAVCQYFEECEKELNSMMKCTLDEYVSIYDLLVDRDIKPYIQNNQVVEAFRKENLKQKFPIYEDIMTKRVDEELEKLM